MPGGNKRAKNRLSTQHNVTTLEQSYEESVLPSAEELSKLQRLDTGIIDWIKNRADIEQVHRHGIDHSQVEIIKENNGRVYRTEVLRIISAVIVILASMVFSAYLLISGLEIQGTIFAGGTIVASIWALLKRTKPPKDK